MPRNNLIKDWNPANPEQGLTRANHQYCCDDSIVIAPFPEGVGKSLRYTIRSNDMIVSSSRRAELQLSTPDDPESSERWYGLRYWIEAFPNANGGSILQWHDKNGTTPPLSIQVSGNSLRVTQSMTSGNTHNPFGSLTLNKPIDVVIHVKWAADKTGILEVWRDGVKMVSKSGIQTNSKGGSYLKLGSNSYDMAPPFSAPAGTKRSFYITEFRVGNEKATYADVAPGEVTIPVPPVPAPNEPPIAIAGPDQTIKLPVNDVTLNASASIDKDGKIVAWQWTGAGAVVGNEAVTKVNDLPEGKHTFEILIRDDKGATATDTMTVTVLPADPIPEKKIVKVTTVTTVHFSDDSTEVFE